MKLAQHQYSGLFGTFLFNTYNELLTHASFTAALAADSASSSSLNCAASSSSLAAMELNSGGGGSGGGATTATGAISLVSIFEYLGKHNAAFVNPVYDARRATSRLVCRKLWSTCCVSTIGALFPFSENDVGIANLA